MTQNNLTLFLYFWSALAVIVFFTLFFKRAPYGRYDQEAQSLKIPAHVSWCFMELPSVITFLVVFLIAKPSAYTWVFFVMWQFHYVYRSLIYPFRLKNAKMVPIVITISATFFTAVNGLVNAYWLTHFQEITLSTLQSPHFIVGLILFVSGFIINQHSDNILFNMNKNKKPGSYQIPYGGMFRVLSSPNYFGEILEWIGWGVATWSLAGFSFTLWTIANLAPRAITHHRWYQAHFSDYPQERKALIPFLF
ncbi:DUF1295 domain-containing protein [Legionella parisiensis]|uniref:3-oxo-5-alpha-steroid 4-dehydrogenase C-terminal domain-containing protein n=1 Tax=Legionella parisiensis TaxID=45071 RepID=A0A1E5JKS0_9GAMM|nr:methyltransferase [Legionella parisiensis]KTD43067.1 3-oxo-5-alpha-steroid 4-dehydrogenase [Legionella parisiensis]OEH45146.1 hypothetical protein lpari_03916 [Legionella parisiensis]STX77854.1 3-oxo-5-alpha-steroid 4-dehydrogenase [Legionella parisiensis]